MKLSAKSVWKTAIKLEDTLWFPKIKDTEWVSANVETDLAAKQLEIFLQGQIIAENEPIFIISSPHDVRETNWLDFLLHYGDFLNGTNDIRVIDTTFSWMLVYNRIGVIKFGRKAQL